MERWYAKLALCLLPMALVPLTFFALAEGYVNLGGGEKDIILILPLGIWSILYAIAFAVTWARRRSTRESLKRGVLVATIAVVISWAGLLAWSLLAA